MGQVHVVAGEADKVKALALSGLERATLALSVDAALSAVCVGPNFPSSSDKVTLQRLRRRLWVSLGVRDGRA